MGKKTIISGQERFDGFAVTVYDGKFAGGFDIGEDMGQELAMDDIVTFIVTGRVAKVAFDETKTGDIKRTNVFQVTSSTALDPTLATTVLNTVAPDLPDQKIAPQMPGQRSIDDELDDELDDDVPELVTTAGPAIPVTDPALRRFLEES